MILAKSEKTVLGNTAVMYWDSNNKKYHLDVFNTSILNIHENEINLPDKTLMFLDKSDAFEIFDKVVLNA